MPEVIPAEIEIGGAIRRCVAEALCKMIADAGVSLDWANERFRPTSVNDLLAAREELDTVTVLRLCDERASWGEFAELEAFLRKHRIAFRRCRQSKYEYDATVAMYHPKCGFVEWLTNNNFIPFVPASEVSPIADALAKIVAGLKDGTTDTVKLPRILQRLCGKLRKCLPPDVPALENFEILDG
jgi:hypothetical protein